MAGLAARQMSRTSQQLSARLSTISSRKSRASRRMRRAPSGVAPSAQSGHDLGSRRHLGIGAFPVARMLPASSSACQATVVVPKSTARCSPERGERKVAPAESGATGFPRSLGSGVASISMSSRASCRQARRMPASSSAADSARVSDGAGAGGAERKRTRQRPQRPSPPHRGRGGRGPSSQSRRARVREAPSGPRASRSRRRPSYQTVSGMAFLVAQRPALAKKKSGGGHIVHAVSTDRKGRSASRGRRPLCAGTALFHAARRS